MSHADAALTPRACLRLAQLVIDDGWSRVAAAKLFMVSPRTASTWAQRYLAEGPAGMRDRSSHPRSSPNKTSDEKVREIVRLRWRHRLGPIQIASRLGMAASTVHAVLVRCRINRLGRLDRVTGERLRRYEHEYPGSLIHVDVTKFANIPDGGRLALCLAGEGTPQQAGHRPAHRHTRRRLSAEDRKIGRAHRDR